MPSVDWVSSPASGGGADGVDFRPGHQVHGSRYERFHDIDERREMRFDDVDGNEVGAAEAF